MSKVKSKINPTQKRINELFDYDGINLVRKTKIGNTKKNVIAGYKSKSTGYVYVQIDNRAQPVHRLIWVILYGYYPEQIDHINGVRHDNRIDNLRAVTQKENLQNITKLRSKNSGVKGVRMRKNGTYKVGFKVGDKIKYFGTYNTLDEAAETSKDVCKKLGRTFVDERVSVWIQ